MKVKLAYISLCLIWGSTWMAIRVVVQEIPPLRAAWMRFVLGAAVLIAVAWWKRLSLPANSREWRAVLVLSLTMMAIPYGLIFYSEQYVTSSITAVLYSTAPLLTALLTPIVLNKSVPRGAILGLLVAAGGIAYLFQLDLMATPKTLAGGVMILIAVLCSAFSTVYARRESPHMHPVVTTSIQLVVGAVFLIVVSMMMEREQVSHWSPKAAGALVFLAIFGSAIAFAVFYWLIGHISPYKAATVNLVVPFVAIIEGSVLLHEIITWHMFLASVVVLGAVGSVLLAQSDAPVSLKIEVVADTEA
ncbi:MAG: EamA family transporter [Acidobacteriales bacterium]|nr:EamA family transporter [Terriglobales bacterium]